MCHIPLVVEGLGKYIHLHINTQSCNSTHTYTHIQPQTLLCVFMWVNTYRYKPNHFLDFFSILFFLLLFFFFNFSLSSFFFYIFLFLIFLFDIHLLLFLFVLLWIDFWLSKFSPFQFKCFYVILTFSAFLKSY